MLVWGGDGSMEEVHPEVNCCMSVSGLGPSKGINKTYFNTYSVLPVETQILAMEPVCPIIPGRESIGNS